MNEAEKAGTDYTVSGGKNIFAGPNKGVVKISGTGMYSGSVSKKFTIQKKDIWWKQYRFYRKFHGVRAMEFFCPIRRHARVTAFGAPECGIIDSLHKKVKMHKKQ